MKNDVDLVLHVGDIAYDMYENNGKKLWLIKEKLFSKIKITDNKVSLKNIFLCKSEENFHLEIFLCKTFQRVLHRWM